MSDLVGPVGWFAIGLIVGMIVAFVIMFIADRNVR